MENVKKFYEAMASDKAMQERANALFKGDEKPDAAALKATIIAFANAEGYSFAEAELEAYAKQAKPLSDEALDAAAGGSGECGCFGVGGGGGTDPAGDVFACACVVGGVGTSKNFMGECFCPFVGAGFAP